MTYLLKDSVDEMLEAMEMSTDDIDVHSALRRRCAEWLGCQPGNCNRDAH